MAKVGLTEAIVILDKSGSMQSLVGDTIDSFNAFINAQKEGTPPEEIVAPTDGSWDGTKAQNVPALVNEDIVDFTLALFSSGEDYALKYDKVNIMSVTELNRDSYRPNGSTALYDAISKTVNKIRTRIEATPEEERPMNVILAILTDGEENASVEVKKADIVSLLQDVQDNLNWTVVYLGANQDAFREGGGMGVYASGIASYSATVGGLSQAYASVNDTVYEARMSSRSGVSRRLYKDTESTYKTMSETDALKWKDKHQKKDTKA